jgi:hypothetical protein
MHGLGLGLGLLSIRCPCSAVQLGLGLGLLSVRCPCSAVNARKVVVMVYEKGYRSRMLLDRTHAGWKPRMLPPPPPHPR